MQFKAGYISDVVSCIIDNHRSSIDPYFENGMDELGKINGLIKSASSFDVDFGNVDYNPDFKNIHPVLAVLNNLITRGLPTRAPIFIEKCFERLGIVGKIDNKTEIKYSENKTGISFSDIFDLLHFIEPGLKISQSNYGGQPGSNLESIFISKHPFITQLLQSQRAFSTINKDVRGNRTVDFSLSSPYLHWNKSQKKYVSKGIIFEIDGPHHHSCQSYLFYDNYRDEKAKEGNFETIRFTTEELINQRFPDNRVLEIDLIKKYKKNYECSIKSKLSFFTLLYTPFCVARIQKTIIELLINDTEILKKENVKIAIVERDLPCGAIAIESLKEIIENINCLIDETSQKFNLPKLEIVIFPNKSYQLKEEIHLGYSTGDNNTFLNSQFDIIIDHSFLRRSNIYNESDFIHTKSVKIRSSHYFDNSLNNNRKIYAANLINYKDLTFREPDGSFKVRQELEQSITYFLQEIFRKNNFRDGQVSIISRAIQQLPVIGLLPTGSGKSITYQLPVFLQPGICLIVDPIKSLMEDQVRVLSEHWIDNCSFINSNIDLEEKQQRLTSLMYGENLFLFISPERLVMQEFRDIIENIDQSKFALAFSYCVVDEVHCVSEWGHEFRSTYLMLGKNAQTYAKTKGNGPVSLIGLTATASFDVLSDIERELQIKHEDAANAIIMIENTIRPELFFRTINVASVDRMKQLNSEFNKQGKNLQKLNNLDLLTESLKHHNTNFNSENISAAELLLVDKNDKILDLSEYNSDDFSSVIFCPVRGLGGANKKGVDYVYLNLNSQSKTFFYSSDDDTLNEQVLRNFSDYTTGRKKQMVCTKAFGMGIDKKDIRNTFHYYHSGSLESLVQEAGRSGRDRKIAEATILISNEIIFKLDVSKFLNDYIDLEILKFKSVRIRLRENFHKKWNNNENFFDDILFNSLQSILDKIEKFYFLYDIELGTNDDEKIKSENEEFRNRLLEKDKDGNHLYIIETNVDRDIHNHFYKNSFKGVEREKKQIENLFFTNEFDIKNNNSTNLKIQQSLSIEFEKAKESKFDFIINHVRIFPDRPTYLFKLLNIVFEGEDIAARKERLTKSIENCFKYSESFHDFLFQLDEKEIISFSELDEKTKEELHRIYYWNRDDVQETGKLIYRMHTMGFLDNYKIDYKKNMYICTLQKYESIKNYLEKIRLYLRRYLSEQTTDLKISELEIKLNKPSLIENIVECLYFLTDFLYQEIADKRKRGIDEIENILVDSIRHPYEEEWYNQNLYIKEQIFFYFNAKYSRRDFMIGGVPYCLKSDYDDNPNYLEKVLIKYLKIMKEEGTEQNNYKHMIGSCRKLMKALLKDESENDWLYRLLKSFSMFSISNISYYNEAINDLDKGFENLYKFAISKNEFNLITEIFNSYFERLKDNINDSEAFDLINNSRNILLQKIQNEELQYLLNKFENSKPFVIYD
jgi:ATP-dependent DNA helicase RecQ